MTTPREDSVLTSILELQRLEDERTRDLARRAEEAERVRLAKLDAVRAEAARAEAERIAKLEAERAAERSAKECAERAEREAREARELTLRAEAEREREHRAEERREAHARAMAEIESRSRAGVRAPTAVAMALGLLAVIGVAGYFSAWRPMMAAHDARLTALREQSERAARDLDAARIAQQNLAARIHDVASRPVAPTVTAVAPPTRVTSGTPQRRGRVITSAAAHANTEAPIDIDGPNVDFGVDDGARVAPSRRPRR